MKRAIYPGSFDPVTFGHMDIITRSAQIVDELVVGVLNNSAKNSLFSLEERVSMIKEMTKNMPNVMRQSLFADYVLLLILNMSYKLHRQIMYRILRLRQFF